ncbi:MAG: hypothetical protein U9R56_05130, partial [candidate division Zixibacteria bacterium]|nr:hypothetical protein [candidate division Zixibacteria bacterium]
HLIIYPTSNNYNIAEILQSIKQSASRRALINTRKSRPTLLELFSTGSKSKAYRFWQAGGGYDKNVVSEVALMNTIDYIHNNPVRAGLVKSAEEWKWSSFRYWTNLGCGPIAIDGEDIPLT